ncbi:MAG: zinc-dependent metalloprotease [Bacteroidota bacterium]
MTPEGRGKLVSQEEVFAQLDALNRDFSWEEISNRSSSFQREFSSLAADMQISFCLAKLTEENLYEAIQYHTTHKSRWPADHSLQYPDSGGVAPIHPEKLINVWVADLGGEVSGFAQMPGGPPTTDGIVVDYRFFGIGGHTHSAYNEGKTLTHLMGNYLNLYPIWGKGERGSDDEVPDTPIHNAPNVGCPGPNHLSTLGENIPEMYMNFMDNTDDACMSMFTQGQKERVHTLFQPRGAREGLLTAEPSTLCQTESLVQAYGIDDREKVDIFPNPAIHNFSIRTDITESYIHSVMVFNSLGRLVYEESLFTHKGKKKFQINCEDWSPGLHVIQLNTSQETITKKLLIK